MTKGMFLRPVIPCRPVRDDQRNVFKAPYTVYGVGSVLIYIKQIIWSQEYIMNAESKVTKKY